MVSTGNLKDRTQAELAWKLLKSLGKQINVEPEMDRMAA